jgi:hypothetical protein
MIKQRRMRWARTVARKGEMKNVHEILVGKPEKERPVGIPRRRWEDDIRMDFGTQGGRLWNGCI